MSMRLMNWARDQKVGDAATKLVLLLLADGADDAGEYYPSHVTLSRDSEIPRRTLQRKLNKLVELGLVEVQPRYRENGGRSSNLYRLLAPSKVLRRTGLTDPANTDPLAKMADRPMAKMVRGPMPLNGARARAKVGAPYEPPDSNQGSSDEDPMHAAATQPASLSFEGASEFEEVRRAWQAADPAYVQWDRARQAWAEWVGPHWHPWQLRDALLTWLKHRQRGGSSSPEWLHILIDRGPDGWGHLVPKIPDANAVPASGQQGLAKRVFGGPAKLRQAIVAVGGEQFVGAYLDPSEWDEATQTIIAATSVARDRLEAKLRELGAKGVHVVWSRQWPPFEEVAA